MKIEGKEFMEWLHEMRKKSRKTGTSFQNE